MRTGSQNTKHNPSTRTRRRNWKQNEAVEACVPAMMAIMPAEISMRIGKFSITAV
jgi:hypothetical protein